MSSSGATINCYDKNKDLVNELQKNNGSHLHEIGLGNLVNNNNELVYHDNIHDCIINAEIIYNKVDAIGVSESSILVQGKSNFVYKVLEDNSVEKIEVSVGKRSYGKIMVLDGLNINDKIIKEGISKVRNKMKVKIVNQ